MNGTNWTQEKEDRFLALTEDPDTLQHHEFKELVELEQERNEFVEVQLNRIAKASANVYLKLLHGRTSPDEQLSDWGTDGPVFGPYEWVHTTYASEVRMGNNDGYDELTITKDGLLYYDGVYYGDWTVFTGPLDSHDDTLKQDYDASKAPVQAVPKT